MTEAALIPGGYVLLSRKLLNSGIMEKPPLYLKLWVWMLMQASFKDHGRLKRGQFFTSLDRMREAMKYKVGASLRKPTQRQIRRAVDFLSTVSAIVTAKVTHGLLITILNYDFYQSHENYEGHSEGHSDGKSEVTILRMNGRMKGKTPEAISSDSEEIRLSELLFSLMIKNNPRAKKPNLQTWSRHIDKIHRIDGREYSEIEKVIRWSQQDSFWLKNILSTEKLRKHFDRLWLAMGKNPAPDQRPAVREVTAENLGALYEN